MNPLLIFILVLTFGIIPLALLVYWYRYRNTILQKTAYAILFATYIIAIISFILGKYGINHLYWYIPVGYIALLLGNVFFTRYVQKPVKSTTEVLDKLAEGNLDVTIDEELKNRKDETGQMNAALARTVDNLKESAEFARQVGEGNFDYDINLLGDSDHLRQALIEMKDKLKEASKLEEEKREEEEKRRWHNEGLAKMNEILRQDDNLEDLAYKIINFLVDYLGANQGGIFIKSEDDDNEVIFDLKAAHAFDRRKYINRTFKLGESLVGTCAIEKEKIYMTEIPNDYIRITSGLGDANPSSLLLIPMKIEENVLGVIEIASFKELENYQIEFVEEASLSIASTLQASETNKRTKELLEKTQQQAEEMSAQEEEMRQNMEELQATQEESSRKAEEYERQLTEAKEYQKKLEEELEKAQGKIQKLEKK
ncbi:MAG: GAF domain-containing protein [Bacteroidota bacterium]